MELWARCATCERWFYCEDWSDPEAAIPACPVCDESAAVIEARSEEYGSRHLRDWSDRLTLPLFEETRRRRLGSVDG